MIELHGDIALVHLTRGCVAIIDAADVPLIRSRQWLAKETNGRLYARSSDAPIVLLHRFLMEPPDDMDVDHKNGISLDNRRNNLRVCTHQQNTTNRGKPALPTQSRYQGVSRARDSWRATICIDSNKFHLGCFKTEVEAAIAFDTAAKLLRGEFARLNFSSDADVPHGEREASRREFRNVERFRRKLEMLAARSGEANA